MEMKFTVSFKVAHPSFWWVFSPPRHIIYPEMPCVMLF